MLKADIEQSAQIIGAAMYQQVPGGEVQVEPTIDGLGVEIVRLMAGTEGRGDGSRAMRAAVNLADEFGVQLSLTPDGSYYEDETAAAARLRNFYARFGFISACARRMIRAPV
ncbi:hypothetical protein DIE18_03220 [Burkholderia sp. Bp9125]|nr:hypothetical protein DIE18_03220 [Burkholderia sp. Bp9125]